VVLDVDPIGTRMLLSAEQTFVLMALECFLGGSPDRPPRERRLTEIDWSLTHRLFDSIVNQLSLVWQDLAGINLISREIELHNDSGQVASVSEPTLVVVIESRVNKLSSMIALLIPWIAIEPVAVRISGRQVADPTGRYDGDGVQKAMSTVPVTLRAEVASVEMPISEVLALTQGSVVNLASPAEQGVSLFAENVRLGHGQPGANGGRRAIQVQEAEKAAL
jgi:flagellar motor switch protein FliM